MPTPLIKYLTFPVGRMLTGSVSKARDKDKAGKPLLTKDQRPRQEWTFGVGYEKAGTAHWAQTEWGAIAWGVGTAGFPGLFNQDGTTTKRFSWKIVDGDSQIPNDEGNKPCDNEGWPGHWVVFFKSSFPPTTWNADGTKAIDPSEIRPGMFVQVAGSIDSNGDMGKPGIYVNHAMVALAGYHPDGEIKSAGADPRQAGFGQGAAPANMQRVPAGALAPNASQPPGPPSAPAMPGVPGGVAAPPPGAPVLPPTAPPTGVAPHPGILRPPGSPPAPVAPMAAATPPPPPPPPPAGPQVTAKAGPGVTWAALQAAGWDEATARAHGMIV